MLKTYKIYISGQVQGVGFRPFVYNLATKHLIKGSVSNDENGVVIYATQTHDNIKLFYEELLKNPPPVSHILASEIKPTNFFKFDNFKIIPSSKNGNINLPLTPDFAICEECKTEINNSTNRRYNYPFTTCVNCGPRWAITQSFPFERNHTSMDMFTMCDDCEKEYTNPGLRRFHSQTNTCSTCGIQLHLEDANSKKNNDK